MKNHCWCWRYRNSKNHSFFLVLFRLYHAGLLLSNRPFIWGPLCTRSLAGCGYFHHGNCGSNPWMYVWLGQDGPNPQTAERRHCAQHHRRSSLHHYARLGHRLADTGPGSLHVHWLRVPICKETVLLSSVICSIYNSTSIMKIILLNFQIFYVFVLIAPIFQFIFSHTL